MWKLDAGKILVSKKKVDVTQTVSQRDTTEGLVHDSTSTKLTSDFGVFLIYPETLFHLKSSFYYLENDLDQNL